MLADNKISSTKNILITGASGFIGSFMTDEALLRGYKVWAGVRKTSNREFLQDKRVEFIDLDYSNSKALSQQIKHIHYVIHCAGITKSIHKADFDEVNYEHSVNLIEALKQSGSSLKKFIQMSSLSVMGIGDEIGFTPFEPTDTPRPNTAYGRSKRKIEEHLEKTKGIPYIIMRPTGVYGPRERDYLMMLQSIKMGIDAKAGFTPQQLTFVYIQDLVDATFSALESSLVSKSYFVSDGNTYTDEEYTQIIKELLNKKKTINIRVPLFLLKMISVGGSLFSQITNKPSTLNTDKYKIMQQRNWRCNINTTIEELNFHPKYNLHEGLSNTIDWYEANGWL